MHFECACHDEIEICASWHAIQNALHMGSAWVISMDILAILFRKVKRSETLPRTSRTKSSLAFSRPRHDVWLRYRSSSSVYSPFLPPILSPCFDVVLPSCSWSSSCFECVKAYEFASVSGDLVFLILDYLGYLWTHLFPVIPQFLNVHIKAYKFAQDACIM